MGFINFLVAISPLENLPNLDPVVGALLQFINSWAGNICWTMIIFTLALKLLTLPLDYMSRKSMKKNAMIQERLKPELEKLEKQCRGDKALYNQKMMARMKKDGYSMSGACLPTLITLGLFIYIFQGLNSFATFTTATTYNAMVETYNEAQVEGLTEEQTNIELVKTYKENNPSWLWIKNPMRPDTWTNAIPTYEEITGKSIGLDGLNLSDGTDSATAKANYNTLMSAIAEEYNSTRWGWNGFVILPLLAMLSSFFSQWVMKKTQPQMDASGGMGGSSASTMKFMMYFFPILMVIFSIQYTSSFAIYIVTNSVFTLVSTLLINHVVGKKVAKEFENLNQISYQRKDNK